MKIPTSRKAGFTLVEIMIVVAIIGLLCAIAIPNFVHARTVSQTDACISNLRQIDAAVQQWALEHNKGPTSTVLPADVKPYLGRGSAGTSINTTGQYIAGDINCPAGGAYSITQVDEKPTCSIPGHVLPN